MIPSEPTERLYRSVSDYKTEDALRRALLMTIFPEGEEGPAQIAAFPDEKDKNPAENKQPQTQQQQQQQALSRQVSESKSNQNYSGSEDSQPSVESEDDRRRSFQQHTQQQRHAIKAQQQREEVGLDLDDASENDNFDWLKEDNKDVATKYKDVEMNTNWDDDDEPAEISLRYDWALPPYDPNTTETQSMKQELHRLQVLRTYLFLEKEREDTCEKYGRLTNLAARSFNVPMTMITLIDLGRAYFLSSQGMGDAVEGPRRYAFCAHTILSKSGILIVPDATLDPRFQKNPYVINPPYVRFYAGVALISPEGYKLGTFCLISSEARPNSLSMEEQEALRELANIVVDSIVERRAALQRDENPVEVVAYAAHDLMTPLTGLQLSLSLLEDDDEVKQLGGNAIELLNTATNCSELMLRISHTIDAVRKGIRKKDQSASKNKGHAELEDGTDSNMALAEGNTSASSSSMPDKSFLLDTNLGAFVKNIHLIMDPIPKNVPLFIRQDPNVPDTILCDDLKLYRLVLNLLTSALERTRTGYILLRISVMLPRHNGLIAKQKEVSSDTTKCNYRSHAECIGGRSMLVFECEDTGTDIPVSDRIFLFQPTNREAGDGELHLCLSSVSSLIGSLRGQFGFRPRSSNIENSNSGSSKSTACSGSIFWFSLPLVVPETQTKEDMTMSKCSTQITERKQHEEKNSLSAQPIESNGSLSNRSFSVATTQAQPPRATPSLVNSLSTMEKNIHLEQPQQMEPQKHDDKPAYASLCIGDKTTETNTKNYDSHSKLSEKCYVESTTTSSSNSSSSQVKTTKAISSCTEWTAQRSSEICTNQVTKVQCNDNTNMVDTANTKNNSGASMALRQLDSLSSNAAGRDKDKIKGTYAMDSKKVAATTATATRTTITTTTTATTAQTSPLPVKRQRKGLVIDDSLVIRKSLSMALKKLGFEVSQACDGMEGLNEMKNNLFDLVLCDFLMPVMDGLDCVKQYRAWEEKHRSWFRQLIIGISAHANDTVAEQGNAAGMDDFKPKPISINLLKQIESSDLVLYRTEQLDQINQLQLDKEEFESSSKPTEDIVEKVNENIVVNSTPPPRIPLSKVTEKKVTEMQVTEKPIYVEEKMCLIGMSSDSLEDSKSVLNILETKGWKTISVVDGINLFRLLQMRSWDAVLVQDDLPSKNAKKCMTEFREWEGKYRHDRQQNAVLLVDLEIPILNPDGSSIVQAPSGFDFVIRRPVLWSDLKIIMQIND